MEYKQRHRSEQRQSGDLTSASLQQRQQTEQIDPLQRKRTELRQAMQPLVSTPIIAQRRSVSPIFRATALQRAEEQSLSSKQESIQRQIDDLGEISKEALGPALQRQLAAETPLPTIKNPRTVSDLVTVMRQRAAATDGKWMGERDRMHFNTLQRHVAANINQAYRKDRQSSEARNNQYGEMLASLHDHPGSQTVSRAVLTMIPKSDQPRLQRALDEALQRKQEQAEQDQKALELYALQKKQAELKEEADQSVFERIQSKKGGGQALSQSVRKHLEQGLNQDLSKVRIHDDAEADKLAKSVNAVAFTTGTDIFFQAGKYDPNSQTGLELLAHEVTHTVQQSKGQVAKGIDPDASLEQEAKEMGKKLAVSLAPDQASAIKTNPLQRPTSQIARISGGLQRKIDQSKQDPADLQAGKKINKPGIVAAKEGANIRSAPEPNAKLVKHLPFNSHLVVQAEVAGGWSRVITADGQMGYTATRFLKHNLPEPSAKLHLVTEGQTALSIARQYYSGQGRFGYDHRDFVTVLAALNPKSLVGTFNPEQWREAKFKANFRIWIPSAGFMQGMKGKYRSASLTIRGVKAAQQAIVDQLNPLAVAGGIAGLVEGFFLQAWDTIKGVFDFVKSIFTGEIINQAKALWQAIQNLSISKLIDHAGQAAGVALDKYNKAGAFERGRMLGKLVGRIVFEIVLGIVTMGAATAASALLRGIPAIAKFIQMLQKAKQAGKLAVGKVITATSQALNQALDALNPLAKRLELATPGEANALLKKYALEYERKVTKQELPPNPDIPFDGILRASTPADFIHFARLHLDKQLPLPKSVKVKYLTDADQAKKISARWVSVIRKRLIKQGVPKEKAEQFALQQGQIDITSKGVFFSPTQELLILPDTVAKMSGSLTDRLYALKTISHEWFHAARKQGSTRVNAFEEGAADLFSEKMIRSSTKTDIPLEHTYGELAEGVELLTKRFGTDILKNSRNAMDQKEYLRKLFKKHGHSDEIIEKVVLGVKNIYDPNYYSSWLDSVKRLLDERG